MSGSWPHLRTGFPVRHDRCGNRKVAPLQKIGLIGCDPCHGKCYGVRGDQVIQCVLAAFSMGCCSFKGSNGNVFQKTAQVRPMDGRALARKRDSERKLGQGNGRNHHFANKTLVKALSDFNWMMPRVLSGSSGGLKVVPCSSTAPEASKCRIPATNAPYLGMFRVFRGVVCHGYLVQCVLTS